MYYFTRKGKALWCLQGWGLQRSWHIFVPTWLTVCLQSFVTKLGIVVLHNELECHAKKWDSIFKVKVTVWVYIIKIWQFLLYLLLVLNQWVFCNQTQSENVGLPCSRSMSQPRLKVSVNVSLDDILCIAEPFVTKPSMVRHHYKPESNMTISIMFWTADFWGQPT